MYGVSVGGRCECADSGGLCESTAAVMIDRFAFRCFAHDTSRTFRVTFASLRIHDSNYDHSSHATLHTVQFYRKSPHACEGQLELSDVVAAPHHRQCQTPVTAIMPSLNAFGSNNPPPLSSVRARYSRSSTLDFLWQPGAEIRTKYMKMVRKFRNRARPSTDRFTEL